MDLSEILKKRIEQAKALRALQVEVGFFEEATYPDGTSVAAVARANEYGVPSRGQPPRSFFRQGISRNRRKWVDNFKVGLRSDIPLDIVFGRIGIMIKEDIQHSIELLTTPRLAESTIRAKMRGNKYRAIHSMNRKDAEKPLMHTLLMYKSVESRVTNEDQIVS